MHDGAGWDGEVHAGVPEEWREAARLLVRRRRVPQGMDQGRGGLHGALLHFFFSEKKNLTPCFGHQRPENEK